ncbi:MAG: phosphopantetheine-binding protein, partial [Geminicoccaceae bacterium]
MTALLTLDRMISVIEKQVGSVDEEITEATHFADIGFDSLDRVEMQFAVEEELGNDLNVDDKVLDDVRTVG